MKNNNTGSKNVKNSLKGGNNMEDISGEFKDMRYSEIFICKKEILIMLSELQIVENSISSYNILITDKTDLCKSLADNLKNYQGKTHQSSANKINSVFVALEIPYQAMVNKAEGLKIFKYGTDFDPKKYACKKAQRRNEKGQLLLGSEPTKGARKRLNRWMSEEGIKQVGIDVFNKMGYNIKN